MNTTFTRTSALALPLLLGIVATAIAATSGLAHQTTSAVQCGVVQSSERGMLALEGTIVSPTALSGEYRLAIQSSSNGGSSTVSQGGYFTANANEPTPIGKVVINAGSRYSVVFDVTAGGKQLTCDADLAAKL